MRNFGERVAGTIPLGISASSRGSWLGRTSGAVRAADHVPLGGERAEPFDLLHVLDGLIGVERAQRRAV